MGVSPVAVGRAVPGEPPYGTSTLKNLKPALFSSVTVCAATSSVHATAARPHR